MAKHERSDQKHCTVAEKKINYCGKFGVKVEAELGDAIQEAVKEESAGEFWRVFSPDT